MPDQIRRDADLDGFNDGSPGNAQAHAAESASNYASSMAVQLRKGYLAYCVLLICSEEPRYTGEIISTLHQAELVVVEGTIYPMLSRLQKEGLLSYEWKESEQGPPRKYYQLTDRGHKVTKHLKKHIINLESTLLSLEKGVTK